MNQNYSRTRIAIGGIVVALITLMVAAACLVFFWLMFEMIRTGGLFVLIIYSVALAASCIIGIAFDYLAKPFIEWLNKL